MKSRDTLVRAGSFDLAEKRRKLADIDGMIAEFQRMAQDLEQQIEGEHVRTGVRDPGHFAYSSFAKAARKRCDNLIVSVADLQLKREAAVADVTAAEDELKRLEHTSERTQDERKSSRRRTGRNRTVGFGTTTRGP